MCSSRRRKTRTKTRKPKFLSLRDQLAPPQPESSNMQLDLFPLHPDNDPHVACLLEQDHEADGGATITALFGGSSSSSAVFDEVPSPVSSTMNWDGDGLARRALRGRERWVFCRSSSSSEEEVVSSGGCVDLWRGVRKGLSLKLDYEEILTAWSDRGSLYIDGEGPQVVPELQHNSYEDDSIAPNVLVEVGNCGGWRVPEVEEVEGEKSSSREARVMRYKEKRQSRLFSKRIRYEVRKLNAEKRPRIKGRFVKRNDDM